MCDKQLSAGTVLMILLLAETAMCLQCEKQLPAGTVLVILLPTETAMCDKELPA